MSYQNSNRKPKIVRPRIDEEAYLTLCSWVGKSNSAKIMVADKMLKAQRDKITQFKSSEKINSKSLRNAIKASAEDYYSLVRMRESKNAWKLSCLSLLLINIASLIFWMIFL